MGSVFFLPYRSKNPPDHIPFFTMALILANVVVYILTSDDLLFIRDDALHSYAVSHDTLSPIRIVTAMFLHANLFHIFGNMLFLWLFGPSVEGRIRPLRFLLVYFSAGLLGGYLQDLLTGAMAPARFNLGASGAIMGVMGAYLYLFPYAAIRAFYFVWLFLYIRFGSVDVQAQWLILAYGALDLLDGVVLQGMDGVGHFCHLGGLAAGYLIPLALRSRRDSEWRSQAQTQRVEARGDFDMMSLPDLQALMDTPTEDLKLIMAYLKKAVRVQSDPCQKQCLDIIRQHSHLLIKEADPAVLASVALQIPVSVGTLPASLYLLMGSRSEGAGAFDLAARLYRLVYEIAPNGPDSEMALLRFGHVAERQASDIGQAIAAYEQMIEQFPHGEMAHQAREGIARLARYSSYPTRRL
jgi:membrane associated rhomboid family serine protease